MRSFGILSGALVMALTTGTAADDGAAIRELAPTGKLRVAIAVGPAPSALWTIRDAATGKARGVPVELGTALAQKLGVPVEMVEFTASGEIVAAADHDRWDVTFAPVDDDRRKVVDFGAPYHLLQSTYLVAPGSTIRALDEVNRAGVRVAGVAGTATFRAAVRTAPNATAVTVKGPDEAIELMGGILPAEDTEWPAYVVGSPERVKSILERMARVTGAAEIMVQDVLHDADLRVRNYELLARTFDL